MLVLILCSSPYSSIIFIELFLTQVVLLVMPTFSGVVIYTSGIGRIIGNGSGSGSGKVYVKSGVLLLSLQEMKNKEEVTITPNKNKNVCFIVKNIKMFSIFSFSS